MRFRNAVRTIENAWIPMPDGCRLAARLWLPEDAPRRPVPAILEYIPYRKRDRTRFRDEPIHHYFAGHGYASVRVDLRGTGDSDGVLRDEYLPREIEDGVHVVEWLAAQPWCDGSVGMIGKSWGGFNALQIAARAPAPLRAILSVCASDDRYADDAHYMGGCLLNENLLWGSVLLSLAALPPDPEVVGRRWRSMWRQRLESLPLYPATWMRHPHRDAYWRHGSVRGEYGRIRCPVYAVGGWADAYTNGIPRLLHGLAVPRKGLVGPWGHLYPHDGVPGPAIGFLQEAIRWWDRWLKGERNGIEDEPMCRVWMPEGPAGDGPGAPSRGRWVPGREVPGAARPALRWFLNAGGLAARARRSAPLVHRSPQSTGSAAGPWCSFGDDAPADQREDDVRSLVFDSEPLAGRLEILGAPRLSLSLSVDRSHGMIAARLCDVLPDGRSRRVTYGLLDLAHRRGSERPVAMPRGRRSHVEMRLNEIAHAFLPEHRVRLALSTAYWPIAWPAAEPVTLTLHAGDSWLELPVRPVRDAEAPLPPFEPPVSAPEPDHTELQEETLRRVTYRDPKTGGTVHEVRAEAETPGDLPRLHLHDIDLEMGHGTVQRYFIRDDDPLSARAEIEHRTVRRRGRWDVRVDTRVRLSSARRTFRIQAEVEAFLGGRRFLCRAWDRRIRRR